MDSSEVPIITEQSPNYSKIGLYRGETGQYLKRGITGYEGELNQENDKGIGPFSIDSLVSDTLRNVEAQGRTEATIFDFGCGEAEMFRDLLTNPDSQTIQFLREHPNINLRMLGLTDTTGIENEAKETSLIGQVRDLLSQEEQQELPTNVQAQVAYYSVTAEQTLETFFQQHGVNTIDIGFSVQALSYLFPRNLDRVLRTIIDHLEPNGGKFIAAPYAERVPGFARGGYGEGYLDIRGKVERPGFIRAVQENGGGAWDPNSNISDEMISLEKMIDKF